MRPIEQPSHSSRKSPSRDPDSQRASARGMDRRAIDCHFIGTAAQRAGSSPTDTADGRNAAAPDAAGSGRRTQSDAAVAAAPAGVAPRDLARRSSAAGARRRGGRRGAVAAACWSRTRSNRARLPGASPNCRQVGQRPGCRLKKSVAQAAVERDRKFALPVAPNRLPDAPLPNDAPMSAPLPCWISTRPIMTSADRICTTCITFNSTCIRSRSRGSVQSDQSAARQMATKSAAFNEAPPIRPPSMSGCPNRVLALSGFTLPP